MEVLSSRRSQNIPTTTFWLQKNCSQKLDSCVITGCPKTNILVLFSFELQKRERERKKLFWRSSKTGSVPVELLPQGWNLSRFGIHDQWPKHHIIHLTSLHRVSMATAAGLPYPAGCTAKFFLSAVWFGRLRCTILQLVFACIGFTSQKFHSSTTTEFSQWMKEFWTRPEKQAYLKRRWVSGSLCLWWNHGSVEMHLYCLMKASRVLDVRTTAWVIKQGKATKKV